MRIEFQSIRMKTFATQYSNYNNALRPFNRENADHISKYDQIEMISAFKTDEFRRMVDAEISYAYAIYAAAKSLERRAKLIQELIDKELDLD